MVGCGSYNQWRELVEVATPDRPGLADPPFEAMSTTNLPIAGFLRWGSGTTWYSTSSGQQRHCYLVGGAGTLPFGVLLEGSSLGVERMKKVFLCLLSANWSLASSSFARSEFVNLADAFVRSCST